MTWLNSLRDQLPLLLVLSPVIGFAVTFAAAKTERDLIRPLAISNSFCTLLILAGVAWQFERELADDRVAIRLAEDQDFDKNQAAASLEFVHDHLDKQRAERIRHQFFCVDGINLWPSLVLIVLTGVIFWSTYSPFLAKPRRGGQEMFVPLVLLFESLSIAALTSCDLKAFLLASGTAAIVMSVIIGAFGGSERRTLAERFLYVQFAGGALVMLGFAMLMVSVPWMKIEDSPTFPKISSNLGMLVYEAQKWSSRNQLAYQYQNEVFPWMLLVLSVGFAIQFGLFPFHSWLISVLSETRREIAVLCLVGTVSTAGIGWHRFVVPLAPDLLVGFERLMLFSALGGAVWGSMRALVAREFRRRVAFLFLGISAVSLLGCYSFTTVGMCGAWVMQQQLILVVCAVLLVEDWTRSVDDRSRFGCSPGVPLNAGKHHGPTNPLTSTSLFTNHPARRDEDTRRKAIGPVRFSTRTLLLVLCLPAVGLFASSSMIGFELLRDCLLRVTTVTELISGSLLLVTIGFVGMLVVRTVHSMLIRHYVEETQAGVDSVDSKGFRGPLIVVGLLVVVANLFPSWMLHQCEPEYDRTFRRFERIVSGK